jgi:hypothetical protein
MCATSASALTCGNYQQETTGYGSLVSGASCSAPFIFSQHCLSGEPFELRTITSQYKLSVSLFDPQSHNHADTAGINPAVDYRSFARRRIMVGGTVVGIGKSKL